MAETRHRLPAPVTDKAIAINADSTAHTATRGSEPNAQHAALSASTIQNPDRLAALISAANGGDTDAAYQLAQGREACMKLAGTRFYYRNQEEIFRSLPDESANGDARKQAARDLADMRAEMQRLDEACVGNAQVTFEELNDLLRRAAQLGSRDAQYEYALDPRLNLMSVGTDAERWRTWRDSAPGYLNALTDRGESRAALAMAAASDQGDCVAPMDTPNSNDFCTRAGGIAMVLPQNAATAYLYYYLDQLLGDNANASWISSEMERIGHLLTPEEISAAQAEARRRLSRIHAQP
jgi:hypothetical protein